jgi:hypothetical protein
MRAEHCAPLAPASARSVNGRRFGAIHNPAGRSSSATVFEYDVQDDLVSGKYAGGNIRTGSVVGRVVADDRIELLFQSVTEEGELVAGRSVGVVGQDPQGRLAIDFDWDWIYGASGGGHSRHAEIR